ncbi:pectinesterase/pectinesterase inhibitor [Vigna angularis]|uniref:Pectinesterase/pectinesterase inhibitor n=1 Tax=Phaseolus angularis TaxID=3914 RepID=A0A8T0KVT7_PHAAN|nr:pectinesterase/pectinesterase inhibitor [Vigna angularis]
MKTWTTLYTLVFLFILFVSSSHVAFSFSDSKCNTTPYPAFCKTTLPPQYLSTHDQCRFLLHQSLSTTKTLAALLSSYLSNNYAIPSSTLHALQDCFNLSQLNIDFFSNVLQAIHSTVTGYQVYDLHTLLSATLTNQQTCLNGFNEVTPFPVVTNALSSPLSDAIKLYSISLALFTRGWVSDAMEGSATVETITNRKLLQTSVDNVEEKEMAKWREQRSANEMKDSKQG